MTPSVPWGQGMRTALVHDWLTGMRGGEKVLEAICELFPDAPLYTLVHIPGSVSARIEERPIHTSFVQSLPGAARHYRQFLPLFPAAVELFDLDDYDLVVSTSHCAAKAVVPSGRAVHISYCHSPMRYAWDQFDAYFGEAQVGKVRNRLLRPVLAQLARWDRNTAHRVDRFVANSRYVAGRIRRYYNRGSSVVYPPVDTAFYRPAGDSGPTRSRMLIVSALVPYKRLDIAIDACRRAGVPLTIVGTGPERARLERTAGPDVEFLGWLSNDEIRTLYRESKAALLPGVEDFGMVPVEAQACGCPVVAFGEGGAAETVIDGETGVLVTDRSVEAFADGVARAASTTFDRDRLRAHAQQFSKESFLAGFQAELQAARRTRAADPAARSTRSMQADDPAARSPRSMQAADPAARSTGSTQADDPAARSTRSMQAADPAARSTRSVQSADPENQQ